MRTARPRDKGFRSARSTNHVLVTCGGKWVGHILQLREAMREIPEFQRGKIFVADRETVTPAGAFADGSFQVPPIADPSYPHSLLELSRQAGIRVIIPLIDLDVVTLAPYRDRFASYGVTLWTPPAAVAELCFDKLRFGRWATERGIPVPRVISPKELPQARFPLFGKRVLGFGSIGARLCATLDDAKRAISENGVFLEEYIPGVEYSVDGYINRVGRVVIRVARVREKIVGGEAFRSSTVRNPEVARLADCVLQHLSQEGHRGPVNIQIICGAKTAVIDVNPRLGSAVLLSNQATGGRLFRSILLESLGYIAEGDPDDYLCGLCLWRFWGEMFYRENQVVKVSPEPCSGSVLSLQDGPEKGASGEGDSQSVRTAEESLWTSGPHWKLASEAKARTGDRPKRRLL